MIRKNNRVANATTMLIIFISVMLALVGALGIMTSKSNNLISLFQENGKSSKELLQTHVQFREVSGENGLNGHLNNFTAVIQADKGSSKIPFSSLLLIMTSSSGQATLRYRSSSSPEVLNNSGYNTWNEEDLGMINNETWTMLSEDLDDDGKNDFVIVENESYIMFNLSIIGLYHFSLGGSVNLANASAEPQSINLPKTSIASAGITYGSFSINGTTRTNMTIDFGVGFVITPNKIGNGYYTAKDIGRGNDFLEGHISENDVYRLYFESPGPVYHNDDFLITILPEKGIGSTITMQASDPFKEATVNFPTQK